MKPSMTDYILRQPEILKTTFQRRSEYIEPLKQLFREKNIRRVYFFGSGTSHHAARLAAMYFSRYAKVEASAKAVGNIPPRLAQPQIELRPVAPCPKTFSYSFPPPGRRFDILVSAMLKQSFRDFIFATNTDGSGKAASYVRALDMLGPILMMNCAEFKAVQWYNVLQIQAG